MLQFTNLQFLFSTQSFNVLQTFPPTIDVLSDFHKIKCLFPVIALNICFRIKTFQDKENILSSLHKFCFIGERLHYEINHNA